MVTISSTLRRIKQDLEPFLPEASIRAACREVGHRWRDRQLDPVATLHLFILQILCFNTAITHLRHLAKVPVTAAAYCKARMRLPLEALQQLLRSSAGAMRQAAGGSQGRWCGLRTYLADGSSTIAPDTPDLQKHFPQRKSQKSGCGFPEVKILGLFDAFSGLIVEVLCFWLHFEDRSQVWKLHPWLGEGDLLVADRGLCSYVHLAMLSLRQVMACFRLHQRQIVDFRPHRKSRGKGQKGKPRSQFVKRLGKHDQIVRWQRGTRPKWMSDEQWKQMPPSLLVRELRYTLKARGQRTRTVMIATTLLDPLKYPKERIAELYRVRWQVETHLRELKTTLKMRRIKSQTAMGVQKEIAVFALVYNLVHAVMLEAARRQNTTPDRISFIDTVRWLLWAAPGEALPNLIVNPHRPDRHEPRVVKDRQDSYPYLNRPRKQLRQNLGKQRQTA